MSTKEPSPILTPLERKLLDTIRNMRLRQDERDIEFLMKLTRAEDRQRFLEIRFTKMEQTMEQLRPILTNLLQVVGPSNY